MGTEIKDLHDRLYVKNYDWLSGLCNTKMLIENKLKAQTVKNGIILPFKGSRYEKKLGGVCDEKFNFISGSAFRRERNLNRIDAGVINGGYSVPESELTYYDEKVIYGGSVAGSVYEPTFLFLAAYIWWCVENPSQDVKIIVLVDSNRKLDDILKKRIFEFLDLLDISSDRVIFLEKPMKFKEVIVPETSICAWKDYYHEYAEIFEKMKSNVTPGKYKKIYLTRREYNKRQNVHDYINEEYFEDFYRKKGFTIIAPEKHSLREQVSLMMGADEIVSVLSSASLFSSSFVKSGTKVVYLNRADIIDRTFETAVMLNQMNNIDYYFIDICYNFLQQSFDFGSYLLGPTSYWKQYVKEKYNEIIDISDEDVLEKYTYHYLKNWLLYCSTPPQYVYLRNTDNFDMLNNACRVILGQELDKSKYAVGLTKSELNRKVNDLNAKLESANKELSNDTRLAKLSAIERQIGSVADTVSKAQLSSAEREDLLKQNAALSAQIETQNRYIDYVSTGLAKMQESNSQLSEVCKSVTDKNGELEKINENISADIALKDRRIEELNSDLSDSQKVIGNLQNDVTALKEHICNMENSRSWKITKPLRAIKRWFLKR